MHVPKHSQAFYPAPYLDEVVEEMMGLLEDRRALAQQ